MVSSFESLPINLLERCPEFEPDIFLKMKSLRQKLRAKLKLSGALLKRKKNSCEISSASVPNKSTSDSDIGQASSSHSNLGSNLVSNYKTLSKVAYSNDPDFWDANEEYSDNSFQSNTNNRDDDLDVTYFPDNSFSRTSSAQLNSDEKLNSSVIQNINSDVLTSNSSEEGVTKPITKGAFKFKTPTSLTLRNEKNKSGSPLSVNGLVEKGGNKKSSELITSFQRFQKTEPSVMKPDTHLGFTSSNSCDNFSKASSSWTNNFKYPIAEEVSPVSE